MNYSIILRVIGQKLEPLRPETYEVVCYSDSYLVRCRVREEDPGQKERETQVRGLKSFLRLWREPESPPIQESPKPETFMNAEFLYSINELTHEDQEHKEPRSDAAPDPYSLSNTLGAVGVFLDRKNEVKLLFVSNRSQEVVILYETKDGYRQLEEFPISTLYDFVVKQYLKEKQ
jgi:hypothetical protein